MCRIRLLFHILALVVVCGCGKKSVKAPESNKPLTTETPKSAPIPPPDAFVISKSEFAVIQRFLDEHYSGFNHTSNEMLGYPKGINVPYLLNGDVDLYSVKYKGLDTLELSLPMNAPLELRAEDVAKIREWITKYWEWKKTSESQHLPEGVPKSLGNVNYREFVFITPNTLQIGEARLGEKRVASLWKTLTTDLPLLRASAMDRIKAASQKIETEDASRAAVESKMRRNRAAVDSALK